MKPFYTIFCLLFITCLCRLPGASAQGFSCNNANIAVSTLNDMTENIKKLDGMITANIYGSLSSADISKYDNRLSSAQEIINKLDNADKMLIKCAEENPNDPNYLVYSSLIKLTALGIVSQQGSYINYLKLNKQTEKKFDDLKYIWTEKEKDLVKTAKATINKVLMFDKSNRYAQILMAVCTYYDKKPDKAIKDLVTISNTTKQELSSIKEVTNEISDKEKLLSFSLTWLGYIYFDKLRGMDADSAFEEVKNINESDNNSVEWIDHYRKQQRDQKSFSNDIRVPDFNVPASGGFYESRILKYQKENPLNHSSNDDFYLAEQSYPIITDQQDLIKQTKDAWLKLQSLEALPCQLLVEQMQLCNGKLKKDNYNRVFCKINVNNGGGGTINLLNYRGRFDEAYSTLNKLLYLRKCWANIINSNPDIPFFRYYRIKVDLAISYLNQNSKSFTDFLDYYKVSGKTISTDYRSKINSDFETATSSEINEDLLTCSTMRNDEMGPRLLNTEINIFNKSPEEALLNLNETKQKIPAKCKLGSIEPDGLLEAYRSYLYLKLKRTGELKQSCLTLSSNPDNNTWIKNLKNYSYYFENEKSLAK